MKDSLANWICGPTGSRRCAVRSGEAIGFGGHAEALQRLQRQAQQLAGEAGARVALVGVDVDAREALALEYIADHRAVLVEGGAVAVDRGQALGVPARPP